jgi:hypothetical protein
MKKLILFSIISVRCAFQRAQEITLKGKELFGFRSETNCPALMSGRV